MHHSKLSPVGKETERKQIHTMYSDSTSRNPRRRHAIMLRKERRRAWWGNLKSNKGRGSGMVANLILAWLGSLHRRHRRRRSQPSVGSLLSHRQITWTGSWLPNQIVRGS